MATKVAPKQTTAPASKVDAKAKEIAAKSKLILTCVESIAALATTLGEHKAGVDSSRKQIVFDGIALKREHEFTPDDILTLLRLAFSEAGDYPVTDLETAKIGREKHPGDFQDVYTLKGMICYKCKDAEVDKMLERIEKGEEFAFAKIKEMLADKNGKASALTQKKKPGPQKGDPKKKPGDGNPKAKFETIEDWYELQKKGFTDALAEGYEAQALNDRMEELLAELMEGGLDADADADDDDTDADDEKPKGKKK